MSIVQEFSRRLAADPRAVVPLSLWAGLALADGILWSRRWSGAMSVPLSPLVTLGGSLIVAAVLVFALVLWRERDRTWFPRAAWWPELLTLALGVSWGIAICRGVSPFTQGGLAALWGLLIVAVGLVHVWLPEGACELASETAAREEVATTDDLQPASHHQKRMVLNGAEVIEGEARVEFQPGQKEAVLHLAFCPPLAGVPDVQGEDSEGGELEVRAEAVHTFGARLSIRRTAGIESAESRQISYVAVPPGFRDEAA